MYFGNYFFVSDSHMTRLAQRESGVSLLLFLVFILGTRFERRGLDLSDRRGLLDFWRRMKIKMAAVT